MEQTVQRNNNPLIVVIIILSLALVGVISFTIYDKLINKEQTPTTNSNQTNTTSQTVNYTYKVANRKTVQALYSSKCNVSMSLLSDVKGNAYLSVHTVGASCSVSDSELNNANKIIGKMVNNKVSGYSDIEGNDTLNSVKLDIANVLTIYKQGMGQYQNDYFYFVKENGTISYLRVNDIFEKGEIIIRDIEGIKNVVSIVSNSYGEGNSVYAITLDGQEIQLVNYLEEYKR